MKEIIIAIITIIVYIFIKKFNLDIKSFGFGYLFGFFVIFYCYITSKKETINNGDS